MGRINITSGDVQTALNRGWSIQTFADDQGLTLKDAEDAIRLVYHRSEDDANKILRKFKANGKKPQPKKKVFEVAESEPKVDTLSVNPTLPDPEANKSAQAPVISILDELNAEKAQRSKEINACELRRNELIEQRRPLFAEIREIEERAEAILLELDQLEARRCEVTAKFDALGEQMNAVAEERRIKLERIAELDAEIERNTVIVIYALNDGTINPDNQNVAVVFDDSGYDVIREWLDDRDECADIRHRDLTTLARLLKIVQGIEATGRQINPLFDNSELEAAFQALRNVPRDTQQ